MLKHRNVIVGSCVAGLILLVLASWFAQQRVAAYARAETGQSLVGVLETTHQAVRSWVRAHQSTALVWANTPQVRVATLELGAALRDGVNLTDHAAQGEVRQLMRPVLAATGYDGYFIIGAAGINLASSRDENIGWNSLLNAQSGFFTRIRAGETAVSLPQPSDVALHDRDGMLRQNLPTMFVGAPIVDEKGQFLAVFTFRIDPREDFTTIIRQGRLGQSGETYAFDGSARLISNSRFEDQLRRIGMIGAEQHSILNVEVRDPGASMASGELPLAERSTLPYTRMAASAIAGESGLDLVGYRDYRGVRVVGAWTWNPQLDLGLATEIDAAEAYATLGLAKLVTRLLTALAAALIVVLTIVFAVSGTRALVSKARLRQIVDLIPSMIFARDASGRILLANRAFAEAHGTTVAGLADVSASARFFADDECAAMSGDTSPRNEEGSFHDATGEERLLHTARIPFVTTDKKRPAVLSISTDVTEARRVEDALRESEAFNRSVLRSLISHIAVLDKEGVITAVNDAWQRFARDNGGGDADDTLGVGLNYLAVCRSATGPFSAEAAVVADGIEAVMEGREKVFTLEYPCHSTDRERWFLLYVTPLSTAQGGAVVAHIDISVRKRAEHELLRHQNELEELIKERSRDLVVNEEQLRDLYENAPVSYLTIDAHDDSIVRHNRALVQLLGYDSSAIAQLKALDLYADVDNGVPLARRIHVDARNGCSVRDVEMRMKRRDGSQVWVSVSMTPKLDASGRAVETRCAILDVTARKRAEAHLRLTEKIFEETAEAILITNASKRIVDVNDAFCEVSGYGRAELLGKTPAMLSSGRHDDEFYSEMWDTLQATGHWRGELWDRRKNGEAYPSWTSISAVRNAAGDVSNYVGVFSDITTIKETERRLEQLAHFDQLTGLANRMLFHDRLRSALTRADRHDEALAVIYVDLDGFKQVNDTLGHQAGDELLNSVADALRTCVREEDTLARLGGDEFAIILGELDRAEPDAELVAERVVEALRLDVPCGERKLRVSASVGVALYPSDGKDANSILRHADQAMYHAKENGKNKYEFFDPVINARVVDRIHFESDLREAVDAEQLFVEYQPILDLESRRVVSLEALVRWRHPLRGIVPPAEFVTFAEETGLIVPVGRYVLSRACDDAGKWRASGREALPVAINLSAVQFKEDDFVADIERLLGRAGLPFDMLQVEVTESLVMDDLGRSVELLERLNRLGVRVLIDDFGTGYSSLSSLSKLPIDVLKIDRSFVNRIPLEAENNAIVSAIISMAHALDKKVIAEGVETPEQLRFLREQQCDGAQGFLLGRPALAEHIAGEVERIERQAHAVRLTRDSG